MVGLVEVPMIHTAPQAVLKRFRALHQKVRWPCHSWFRSISFRDLRSASVPTL